MTALRSIAACSARRTRTSSNGFFLLLMLTIVLPSVPPIATVKRWSFWNCFRLCGEPKRGIASTSPASSAATCAAGSLMKRKVTFSSLTAAALRKPSHLLSVIALPLAQLSNLNGPVPTGLVAVVAALFGSRITAVFSPMRNRKLPSALFEREDHRAAHRASTTDEMLSNTAFFALFVLPSAFARSKLNFTSEASKASPSWNLTPLLSLKV